MEGTSYTSSQAQRNVLHALMLFPLEVCTRLVTFDVLSNCENVNLTLNNLTGQEDTPFTIRVFNNNDKFFKIDSLTASAIPQSKSVSFIYTAPLQHKFLTEEGTYRFVMIQKQTTGAGTCTLVSDTVVYEIREPIGIVLGQVKPSFPDPKRTGSIEIENIIGGQRFVSGTNELYYEVSLTTADDDIVVFDWSQLKLNPQNKFSTVFDYLPPGVYRVKVRDATGCIKTQDVDVSLDPSVYVPNIFTPNDDGVNDEFEILNLPADGKHKIIVSNRWGMKYIPRKITAKVISGTQQELLMVSISIDFKSKEDKPLQVGLKF